MKAVILAGGFGTRLAEETGVRPKPMVKIGERPILWHIMKIYSAYGINEFIICCGYKGRVIKEYFSNYFLHMSDVTFDMRKNNMEVHRADSEPWRVTLIDTGLHTMTGGRLKRVRHHLDDETFCFTYGDGVADINISELIAFHRRNDSIATLTAVQPPGRFGAFRLEEEQTKIHQFREKPHQEKAWINGGFFVLEPEAIEYIEGDETVWEREPLEALAQDGELSAFRHTGFWHPMDTLRDKKHLEAYWQEEHPPWRVWESKPTSNGHVTHEQQAGQVWS
jgi:glucose-1-phosphate cytidylyltransferase